MTKKICAYCGKVFFADEDGKPGRKKKYCSPECYTKVTVERNRVYGAEYRAKKKQEQLQEKSVNKKKGKVKEPLHEANAKARAFAKGMSYGQYYAMIYAEEHRHDAKKRR